MKKLVPVLDCDSNFITFKVEDPAIAFDFLLSRGVLVRNISKYQMLAKYLRVNVGTKEENSKFLAALREYLSTAKCNTATGIIFDIDGVLVDVSKSYRTAIIETVRVVSGKKITDADIDQIKKKPNSNNDWDVSYALAYGVEDLKTIDRSDVKYKKLKSVFQKLYLDRLRNLETPIAKLKTLNSLLASGYRLGIVTSRPRDEALYVLDRVFPKIFDPDCVVALEDCQVEKPNPEPVTLAAKKMGCNPSKCVYVGDTINDMIAAKAAGVKFVSVTKGLGGVYVQDVNQIRKVL
jgi:HAD superfamily hydrolase (TIGR01548 family)